LKKEQQELAYKKHIKESYLNQMNKQDSEYSTNLAELAELERQEKAMVDKLNQTRMSAMSVKSNHVTLGQKNGISPFKS
jgi:hypothetical protein